MQCNIDASGKLVRLALGVLLTVPGLIILVVEFIRSWETPWLTAAGLALLITGIVGVLEGWAGWCVVRGLGFRTRI